MKYAYFDSKSFYLSFWEYGYLARFKMTFIFTQTFFDCLHNATAKLFRWVSLLIFEHRWWPNNDQEDTSHPNMKKNFWWFIFCLIQNAVVNIWSVNWILAWMFWKIKYDLTPIRYFEKCYATFSNDATIFHTSFLSMKKNSFRIENLKIQQLLT